MNKRNSTVVLQKSYTGATVGNIAEHPYEIHHHHLPKARHDDPDAEVLGHWILAAAILGSSMAFINGTVTNVALPSLSRAISELLLRKRSG